MSKVTKVFYKELESEKVSDFMKSMDLYYQLNLTAWSEKTREVYEDYMGRVIQAQNMEIHTALVRDGVERWPKNNKTIFGISGLKNRPILIAEY